MKLIKRISIITVLLFMFIPIGNISAQTYDYTNGLLDSNYIKSSFLVPQHYDNDVNTSGLIEQLPSVNYIEFNEPVDIKAIYYNGDVSSNIKFYFKHTVHSMPATSLINDGYTEVDFKGVIRIEFYEKSVDSFFMIKEIEFFGEVNIADADGDGIPDSEDPFPDDPTNGDADGDGIPDSEDEYPDDPTNTPPPDSDGDGIPNNEDEFPDDPENKLPEVSNLEIKTSPGRVDLTWNNPEQYFEKAIIYRKTNNVETAAFSISDLNPFKPMVVSAAEKFTPIFETNGTKFSDLTVEEGKTYSYKVTNYYNGMESDGVIVSMDTPVEPPLVDTGEAKIPFGVKELISSGSGLLGLIGGFVLLALAFVFVPKVIKLIRQSFQGTSPTTGTNKDIRLMRKIERQQEKALKLQARQERRERKSNFIPRETRISRRGG
jgi:hypothetical protein